MRKLYRATLAVALLLLSLPAAAEVTPETLNQLKAQTLELEKLFQAALQQCRSNAIGHIEAGNQKILQLTSDLRRKQATCAKAPTPSCDRDMQGLVSQIDRLSNSQRAEAESLQRLPPVVSNMACDMIDLMRKRLDARQPTIDEMR